MAEAGNACKAAASYEAWGGDGPASLKMPCQPRMKREQRKGLKRLHKDITCVLLLAIVENGARGCARHGQLGSAAAPAAHTCEGPVDPCSLHSTCDSLHGHHPNYVSSSHVGLIRRLAIMPWASWCNIKHVEAALPAKTHEASCGKCR